TFLTHLKMEGVRTWRSTSVRTTQPESSLTLRHVTSVQESNCRGPDDHSTLHERYLRNTTGRRPRPARWTEEDNICLIPKEHLRKWAKMALHADMSAAFRKK